MISAAGKKRIAAAQRARWAKQRKAKPVPTGNFMAQAMLSVDEVIATKKGELANLVKIREVLGSLAELTPGL